MKRRMAPPLSHEQLVVLAQFLEKNPNIAKNNNRQYRTTRGRCLSRIRWEEISSRLNAVGVLKKDGRGWSKYWTDRKCSLKKRAYKLQCSGKVIDDERAPLFSDTELKLLNILGDQSTPNTHDPFVPAEQDESDVEVQWIFPDESGDSRSKSPVNIEKQVPFASAKEDVPMTSISSHQASIGVESKWHQRKKIELKLEKLRLMKAMLKVNKVKVELQREKNQTLGKISNDLKCILDILHDKAGT